MRAYGTVIPGEVQKHQAEDKTKHNPLSCHWNKLNTDSAIISELCILFPVLCMLAGLTGQAIPVFDCGQDPALPTFDCRKPIRAGSRGGFYTRDSR